MEAVTKDVVFRLKYETDAASAANAAKYGDAITKSQNEMLAQQRIFSDAWQKSIEDRVRAEQEAARKVNEAWKQVKVTPNHGLPGNGLLDWREDGRQRPTQPRPPGADSGAAFGGSDDAAAMGRVIKGTLEAFRGYMVQRAANDPSRDMESMVRTMGNVVGKVEIATKSFDALGGADKMLAKVGAPALTPLAAVAVAATAAIGGLAAIISTDFREGLLEYIGWTDRATKAKKEEALAIERYAQRLGAADASTSINARRQSAREDAIFSSIRGDSESAVQRRSAAASNQYADATTQMRNLRQNGAGSGSFALELQAAAERQADAAAKLVEVEEQRGAIGIAFREKEIDAARQVLSFKERERDTAMQMANADRRTVDSAETRLAQLNPAEALALRDAAGRARSGEDLSRNDVDRLRGLGLYDESVQDADRRRVSDLGLDPVLADARASASRSDAMVARMAVDVKTQGEVVLKLDLDKASYQQSTEEAIEAVVGTLLDARDQAIEARFERERREMNQKYGGGLKR